MPERLTGQIASKAKTPTQGEMEAATSSRAGVTPLRQYHHPGMAKGWLTTTDFIDTISPDDSFNVASVTDSGSGVFIVVWAEDFSSVNYPVFIGMNEDLAETDLSIVHTNTAEQSEVEIRKDDSGGPGLTDLEWSIVALGDQ